MVDLSRSYTAAEILAAARKQRGALVPAARRLLELLEEERREASEPLPVAAE
jgi:hypothetical protein